ncbi:MAG TPA: MFS transporter [Burkholderiales bacterium]|nr:MFS transporter [Burkholderiales bacterium]
MESRFTPALQRRTIVKVWWRLLPLVMVAYLVAYIDRTNIAVAALTMNTDLGFSAYLFGWGAGIFFLGYAVFEVPSNMILHKVGARRWIARIMISWGIVSGLMAFVQGPVSFLALRFLLGVAEAGFFPGIILYLTYWFPKRYRARVISSLFVAVPVANGAASMISGAILGMDGIWGLRGWQWVFIIEAVPAILLAFVVLRYMTDRPALAAWLQPEEREWLQGELDAERRDVESRHKLDLLQALTDPRVLILSFIYFASATASYGIAFFLPQIVKGLGQSNFMTGILSGIPYFIGVLGLLAFGYSSDRMQERRWHLICSSSIAGAGFLGMAIVGTSYWALVFMSIATIGIYGSRPSFWSMPSLFLTGTAAAAGIALINSIGNLGGHFGPMIVGWIRDSSGSFEAALYFLSACAFASGLVTFLARGATGARK